MLLTNNKSNYLLYIILIYSMQMQLHLLLQHRSPQLLVNFNTPALLDDVRLVQLHLYKTTPLHLKYCQKKVSNCTCFVQFAIDFGAIQYVVVSVIFFNFIIYSANFLVTIIQFITSILVNFHIFNRQSVCDLFLIKIITLLFL
jgi:hypothetical protein